MKHLMKKLTALFLATLMTLSLGAAWAGAESEQFTIGIAQFAEHCLPGQLPGRLYRWAWLRKAMWRVKT